MKNKENNLTYNIIGFILIGLGLIFCLINFASTASAEYITHQTYYSINQLGNLLFIMIGVILIK